MCGIVGYVGQRDCSEVLINALSKLEYRGYDSAGIAVVEDNKIDIVKSKGRLTDLEDKMKQDGQHRPQGHVGIGHTRWATHGEPSDVNSHPHSAGDVTIVHNGIIENFKQLKEELIAEGEVFLSATDTEVVVKLLNRYYDGEPFSAIEKTLARLKGSYALGILFADRPDTVYAVRCESPLIVAVGENESFIASDVPAILKYTRDFYLLESGEVAVLNNDGAVICNSKGEKTEKELKTADWDEDAAEKQGYEFFMLKEIHEQPAAFKTTVMPRISDGLPNFEECGLTHEALKGFKNIYIVACGTAMHAGMMGKYLIEKLARIPVTVDIASEFRYRDPIVGEGDLVIIISQSGETADSLAAMRLSQKNGATTLAIVNAKGSTIAREADMLIYTHAGPEIAVASTKAYMVQVAVMYLLAFELAYAEGKISEDECRKLVSDLIDMPELIEKVLEDDSQAKAIAEKLVSAENLLYIGRGLDYALSMEGSLKLKEITYIHSEAYAAGELKHGTISLVTEDMPVVAVATQSDLYEKTVSNIVEVRSRGAKVFAVTMHDAPVDNTVADEIIRLPRANEMMLPLLATVHLQLIAYHASYLRGNDVDKPRNLAKSVTVE